MRESLAFEVDNLIKHRVRRSGPHERVSLVIDVAEQACARYVEVGAGCRSLRDPRCFSDFNATLEGWLGRGD